VVNTLLGVPDHVFDLDFIIKCTHWVGTVDGYVQRVCVRDDTIMLHVQSQRRDKRQARSQAILMAVHSQKFYGMSARDQ
jgi:hypothetical protein